jgi:hypothetical protein
MMTRLACLALALLGAAQAANMNGDYLLANPNPNSKTPYVMDFGSDEYFEVYSPPITTRYSEVFWTMCVWFDLSF